MISDVEYLIESLSNFADTNQIVISYNGKLNRVERLDYYPDGNGCLSIKKSDDWSIETYSVYEFKELLLKYADIISDIKFEAYDSSEQGILNVYETEDISGNSFFTVLMVGVKGEKLELPDNVSLVNNLNVRTIL